MKKIGILLLVLVFAACSQPQKKEVQKITPDQMLEAMEVAPIQLLDVRTEEEFKQGSIQEAHNICITDEDFEEKIKRFSQEKPIYIYCKSGVRSAKAAKKLKEMGFQEIYDMHGGIDAWYRKGLDVQKSS